MVTRTTRACISASFRGLSGAASLTLVERRLEGVVAKPHRFLYQPAKRTWIKIKNRDYWRRESEIAAMQFSRR
jgi:ATP-dependent DNA ligase